MKGAGLGESFRQDHLFPVVFHLPDFHTQQLLLVGVPLYQICRNALRKHHVLPVLFHLVYPGLEGFLEIPFQLHCPLGKQFLQNPLVPFLLQDGEESDVFPLLVLFAENLLELHGLISFQPLLLFQFQNHRQVSQFPLLIFPMQVAFFIRLARSSNRLTGDYGGG